VLSTATSAPVRFAAAQVSARSVIRSSGLLGVSIQTSEGERASAASRAAGSVRSASSTSSQPLSASARRSRQVLP